ncbi:MAG: hypothetical protein ABJL57_16135 [Hyphomonas sp.]|uniref:hypothetical protein n=1 Tax=Hyphomonas sp. TaxID=87 RepID=UPI003266AEC9
MAKKPIEILQADVAELGERQNASIAEVSALRAILSSLLIAQRMDPRHGAGRLAFLRETAAAALPLPEDKGTWQDEDHMMRALFTEIFDSVEHSVRSVNGEGTRN